ncbi:hypothetical protein F5Y00DRAFT_231252 [Daldinia vernicosa]|uniref:uncharacterized protein n=1 Tax=Daldinia vernicosa TaxID=114800 RepID=UPI00200893FE|nr:uncharacterized protein F5Y00DRAFT_231252 [Daldinia vernicosa]KAI0850951.1 hypothetical protein F5Y00DRAFT_231252 [Daldinia vernicosa]
MSASPTSIGSSQVAADQPKDTNAKDTNASDEPLSGSQPKSQDANHGDPTPSESPEQRSSAAPESSTASPQSRETGEASPVAEENTPPLPNEPLPATEDDGWDFHWDATSQAYFFYNRFTHETTWENPRLANKGSAADSTPQAQATVSSAVAIAVEPPKNERPPAGGYNPAIHGDYDPNAWYAKQGAENALEQDPSLDASAAYAAMGTFNRFTGRWQGGDQNPDNHNDEAKSRRQMNAFFDVDAAANSHDGRSLKAERSGKKPTRAELKQFKEKRRARKEEKRRAWLRD